MPYTKPSNTEALLRAITSAGNRPDIARPIVILNRDVNVGSSAERDAIAALRIPSAERQIIRLSLAEIRRHFPNLSAGEMNDLSSGRPVVVMLAAMLPIDGEADEFVADLGSFKMAAYEALAVNVFAVTERLRGMLPSTKRTILDRMAKACGAPCGDGGKPADEESQRSWFWHLYHEGEKRIPSWYENLSSIEEMGAMLQSEGKLRPEAMSDDSSASERVEIQFKIVGALLRFYREAQDVVRRCNVVTVSNRASSTDWVEIVHSLKTPFSEFEMFVAAFHGKLDPSKLNRSLLCYRQAFVELRRQGEQRRRANAPQLPYDHRAYSH